MIFRSLYHKLKAARAQMKLQSGSEQGCTVVLLFHSIRPPLPACTNPECFPHENFMLEDMKVLFNCFQAWGYRWISADEIGREAPGEKRVCLTFDDGYYNNVYLLPLLREYKVPVLVHISTAYVQEKKEFWWETAWRSLRSKGISPGKCLDSLSALKDKPGSDLEAEFSRLRMWNDATRPFTPDELKDFAREPLVTLGNHTRNHVILTQVSEEEARREIQQCADDLREMTGHVSEFIAYPNGNHSPTVLSIAGELGYRKGFTVEPGKVTSQQPLQLPRNQVRADTTLRNQLISLRAMS